jgi:hypothetical protein
MVDYQPLNRIPGPRKQFDHQYDLHQFTEDQSVFIFYENG